MSEAFGALILPGLSGGEGPPIGWWRLLAPLYNSATISFSICSGVVVGA